MWGWHFLREDCKLQYGSREKVVVGEKLGVKPPLQMCHRGLHASERLIDALYYAPGPIVCRIQLSGEILHDTDKACAEYRRVVWMYDASRVLHEFACVVAERALLKEREAGREPDKRSWDAIQAKKDWMAGIISDDELCAAERAAWSVGWSVGWNVGWNAVRSVGWSLAWGAVKSVGWSLGWSLAWGGYNLLLTEMIQKGRPRGQQGGE